MSRYELRNGRFGAYFHDSKLSHPKYGGAMDLADVVDRLNQGEEAATLIADTCIISIRVTSAEKHELKEAAAIEGKTLSAFLLDSTLEEARKILKPTVVQPLPSPPESK